ncbi:MAG: thiol-disulfide isomerase, partial [Candidatus Adlerbacteria bacterium]|nr:thiol-disulfide isomerase [Candidatus Adlerbacteria bacterium]
DGYINTDGQAIKLSDYIGKKVILVDFWTYSCINCQRTIPYLENWYKKYGPNGFVIVGVHTPEFNFEKQLANVQAGVLKFGITYPVVLDSENQTWDAYHNNYWPEEYLIDIDGLVREHNIGEGNYQETEASIQKLLLERAKTLSTNDQIPTGFVAAGQTIEASSPETYFDWQRNEYLGNGIQHSPGVQTFKAPATVAPNTLYLDGTWNIGDEFAENTTANAGISFHYKAKGVYFVASSAQGSTLTIYVDGKVISTDKGADVDLKGQVHVKEPRLYKLIEHVSQQEHVIQIKVEKPGLDAYTFTFGLTTVQFVSGKLIRRFVAGIVK